MELNPNELFFWEPIALAGTPFEINRVVLLMFVASAACILFFLLFANLLEIVPGINFPVTSRMAIPAVLAFLSYVIFVTVGIIKHGPVGYFKGVLFPPGVPWP